MDGEKVTVEQAVNKLSEANNTSNNRLTELEKKMNEICDVQYHDLKSDVRNMRNELSKIFEAITMSQMTRNDDHRLTENKTSTPHNDPYTSPVEESFECAKARQHTHHTIRNENNATAAEQTSQAIHTIVMPPADSIPTFRGDISESPRQFLMEVKEYAETTNHWNEQALLNGMSQFLRGTARQWHCDLRESDERPKTWADFVAVFLDQFNSPVRQSQQEQLWKECKQEENETISSFVVRLRALWREQKPGETKNDLGQHFKCKIKDNIALMMGVPRGETLEEIIMEARKAEEIIFKRAKQKQQSQNSKQKSYYYNANSTPIMDEEEQYEVQAISAQQRQQYHNSYTRRPQYTNYSSQKTTDRRDFHSNYDITCYACGWKGHTRNNCPNQYNGHQQQTPQYYPKNDKGARAGRGRGAPM